MRRLLYEACPGVLASQEYSHEALIEDIAMNPHRLFIYDEAESYFKMLAQKYNAPMRSAMMSLYNGVPMQRQIKGRDGAGKIFSIENSYIAWGGASTPFQISTHLNGSTTDLLSGMFPRFILVPYFGEEASIEDPPPDDKDKRRALVDRLKELSLMGEREYVYTNAALKAKHDWLSRFNKRAGTSELLLSAFYRKMRDEHIHKISILSAFERNSSKMDTIDIENSIDILWPVEKSWPALLERLTEKEWDRETNRVRDFLKAKSARWVSRSEILRAVRGIKAQKLTAIIAGFYQDNQVKTRQEAEGDRPTNFVQWVGED